MTRATRVVAPNQGSRARRVPWVRNVNVPELDYPYHSLALQESAALFRQTDPELKDDSDTYTLDQIRGVAGYFRALSRKQHLRAISCAFLLWIRSANDPEVQLWVRGLQTQRKRWNKRTTALHLIVEAIIVYGDERNPTSARRLHQRDVAAISFLAESGVGPSDLQALADRRGQGLDTWAKAWAKLKKASSDASQETRRATPDIRITITSTGADGTQRVERLLLSHSDESKQALAALIDAGTPIKSRARRSD